MITRAMNVNVHHTWLAASNRGRSLFAPAPSKLPSSQVGDEAWNAQQGVLSRLAAEMHASVATGSDEVVKAALVLHGKLDTLVYLLLVFEVTP